MYNILIKDRYTILIQRGSFCSCFLGYKLDKDWLRQGLMSEAVNECVRIAFEELGLHRIEANIMPRNIASLGVVRRCGFVEEGGERTPTLLLRGQEEVLTFAPKA